jgi:hypothetical protein
MKAGSCLALFAFAALAACGKNPETVHQPVLTATLDLEIVDSAEVHLSLHGDDLTATLTPDKGYGVMPAGKPLEGQGHVEHFPEANATLYTARFSAPADASGPCGNKPVSLALALHRDEDNARVQGSLTPYCGRDVWFGTPAHTPLRLSGDLPLWK